MVPLSLYIRATGNRLSASQVLPKPMTDSTGNDRFHTTATALHQTGYSAAMALWSFGSTSGSEAWQV